LPAVCGAFFINDVPGVGHAGDGTMFQTCVPGVGTLAFTRDEHGLVMINVNASPPYVQTDPSQITLQVSADKFSGTFTTQLHEAMSGPPVETVTATFHCP
jgi:hypothetical protein